MFFFPCIANASSFEMTPLLPTTEYDARGTSFMPYALARMAWIRGTGAVFDLLAFVTEPEKEGSEDFFQTDDLLAVSFNFCPSRSDRVLTFLCNASDRCAVYLDGVYLREHSCVRRTGEDERGVFWNVSLTEMTWIRLWKKRFPATSSKQNWMRLTVTSAQSLPSATRTTSSLRIIWSPLP